MFYYLLLFNALKSEVYLHYQKDKDHLMYGAQ
jgi:hypothetical protein